jgi:hypothetical protein
VQALVQALGIGGYQQGRRVAEDGGEAREQKVMGEPIRKKVKGK